MIPNNDPDENPYDFAIQGFAVTAPPATLGNYADASVLLSQDAVVTPSVAPTDSNSTSISTAVELIGKLTADRITGVVRITNAHPARIPPGVYPVTVTATGYGGFTTASFGLTVDTQACGGTSGFASGADLGNPNIQSGLIVGDFNRDGHQDIASILGVTNRLRILSGDGASGFTFLSDVNVGTAPQGGAIGDFDNDGNQDIAAAGSSSVSIRLGDGLGGFSGTTEVPVNATPWSLAIGDFNGDGFQDLASTSYSANTVSIRHGDGMGGFSAAGDLAVGDQPLEVAIGDFNEDARQDLVTAKGNQTASSLRLGTCLVPELPFLANGFEEGAGGR